MNRVLLVILMSVLLSSCDESEESMECCFEPAGAAYYYINNQTSSELTVSFVTSEELGCHLIDSISPIATNLAAKILDDGIIGVNPKPSDSFKSLSITRTDNQSEFQISSIENNSWEITSKDFIEGEYGLTKYQLTISDSNF